MQKGKLRSSIIAPIVISMLVLLASFSLINYRNHLKETNRDFDLTLKNARSILESQMTSDAQLMGIIIKSIMRDEVIRKDLKRKDRAALLRHGRLIFDQAGAARRINQFYFIGPDRTMILRVHQPERYGDVIDRLTLKKAAATGRTSSGIELGPLGTYTLRVVTPVFEGKELIGFIELGEEIGHITGSLKDILKLDFLILIEKRLLNRDNWEAGMKMLGRESNWDQLPSTVISYSSLPDTKLFNAETVAQILASGGKRTDIESGETVYGCGVVPLQDVAGVQTGSMVIVINVTAAIDEFRTAIFVTSTTSILVGLALLLFFFAYLSRIEAQISQADFELRLSEERFRTISVSARDAIIITDEKERISYWNPSAARLLGYSPEEALGKEIRELAIPGHLYENYSRVVAAIRSGEGLRSAELEVARKDGSIVPIEIAVSFTGPPEHLRVVIIARDISLRRQKEMELRKLSYLDSLTGVANRRHFDETLESEWKRAARTSSPLSLLMCDIDFFKQYNDIYGHQAGDECLRRVAACLGGRIRRAGEVLARYGGEEFAVILPGTNRKDALMVAERLRSDIETMCLKHEGSTISDRLTISVGIATVIPSPAEEISEIIRMADRALYKSKQQGRNRIAEDELEPGSAEDVRTL